MQRQSIDNRPSSSDIRVLPPIPSSASGPILPEIHLSTTINLSDSPDDVSGDPRRLSMTTKRTSLPRPSPIVLPDPVHVPHPVDSTAESSSSDGSAGPERLADVRYSPDLSSAYSPKETNTLLSDGSHGLSSDKHLPAPIPRNQSLHRQRPLSASEPGTAARMGSSSTSSSVNSQNSRPYSSADIWAMKQPSSSSLVDSSTHQFSSQESTLRPMSAVRSRSSNFIPSPLNPNAPPSLGTATPRRPNSASSRPASMVLYRLAGIGDEFGANPAPMSSLGPPASYSRRASRFSTISSTNSIYSVASDSKYPMPMGDDILSPPPSGAFLPYEYDPSVDLDAPDDAEDALHEPDPKGHKEPISSFNARGICNIFTMLVILLALVTLFIVYPILLHFDESARRRFFGAIGENIDQDGNSSGRSNTELVDKETPPEANTRIGFDGNSYSLVFSDEFNKGGRTFNNGDDPFWEAVSAHDAKNSDLQYYEPDQITTRGGKLVIKLTNEASNGFEYRSGMLQSWNKFCFTSGYIEVSVSIPGSATALNLSPQIYTLGNLARAGYPATEEGVFPYSYDACDTGINQNQALTDGTIPVDTTGAQLSGLRGQRISSCTCPDSDHPGPRATKGRGAPQIDILSMQRFTPGASVAQSLRFAPLSDQRETPVGAPAIEIHGAGVLPNGYTGGTTEQHIGPITPIPADVFTGEFVTLGYEHFADNTQPTASFITWTQGQNEMLTVTGEGLAADPAVEVSQRLIPEEPMSIVFSLAISRLLSEPVVSDLTFPVEMQVDYVRVYQRDGAGNHDCDPNDYPTKDYIDAHPHAYSDSSKQTWEDAGYTWPTNQFLGGC